MLKRIVKNLLRYHPADETTAVRDALEKARTDHPNRPFCPSWEGDLIHSLISKNRYARCLETGFGTGSSTLYMLNATADCGGHVTSLDWSATNFNNIGKEIIAQSCMTARHTLIEEPSHMPMARLLTDGPTFDFAFIDGWKTFDYLAYEIFILNRLLRVGGCVMFDDTYLPSVRKIIAMLRRHYEYEEINYRKHGQPNTLRTFHILTTKKLHRPYRALIKTKDVSDQPPSRDWMFYRRF